MESHPLLTVPAGWDGTTEFVEAIFSTGSVRLERIISKGHMTPEGSWYDQGWDEWVAVIQGEATLFFDDGTKIDLRCGDSLLIPAHRRHRVISTSSDPPCVWLALHGPERP